MNGGDPVQWDKVVEEHVRELEHALGVPRPPGVVECIAHTLDTHPPLGVGEEAMGRVIMLLTVTYSQGQAIEAQRVETGSKQYRKWLRGLLGAGDDVPDEDLRDMLEMRLGIAENVCDDLGERRPPTQEEVRALQDILTCMRVADDLGVYAKECDLLERFAHENDESVAEQNAVWSEVYGEGLAPGGDGDGGSAFASITVVDPYSDGNWGPCTCVNEDPATGECMPCGVRDCPESEPLHYHHDGCPACDVERDQIP